MTKEIKTAPRTEVRGVNGTLYHVWFSPRRRKPILLGDIDEAVKRHFAAIAQENKIEILECETGYDHVHLLVKPPPKMPLSEAMRLLKGASARYIFREFDGLKIDLRNDHFWQRGYGFRRVNPGAIRSTVSYIRNHRSHDDLEPRTSVRGDWSISRRQRDG